MARSVHGTLTANTVATVTVEVGMYGMPELEVVNRDGAGEIYLRLDGVNPTVAGDDTFVVLGARQFLVPGAVKTATVKMISATAVQYSVEGKPL